MRLRRVEAAARAMPVVEMVMTAGLMLMRLLRVRPAVRPEVGPAAMMIPTFLILGCSTHYVYILTFIYVYLYSF